MKVSNGIKKILSDRREIPSRRDLDGNFFTMWRERVYIYKYIEWRKSAGCFVYAKLVR